MHEDFVTYEQAVKLKEIRFDWYNQYTQMYYATQNYCEGNNPLSFDTIGPGDLISSPKMKEDENDGWIEDEDYCVLAPPLSQAQRWLREEKDLVLCVGHEEKYYWYINEPDGTIIDGDVESILYKTYEEALLADINRALELLTDKNEKK